MWQGIGRSASWISPAHTQAGGHWKTSPRLIASHVSSYRSRSQLSHHQYRPNSVTNRTKASHCVIGFLIALEGLLFSFINCTDTQPSSPRQVSSIPDQKAACWSVNDSRSRDVLGQAAAVVEPMTTTSKDEDKFSEKKFKTKAIQRRFSPIYLTEAGLRYPAGSRKH